MSNRQEKDRRRQTRLAAEQAQASEAARRRKLRLVASVTAALAAMALVVVLVVSGRDDSSTAGAPAIAAAPALPTDGVPPQIAANAADANKVLDGSIRAKLAALRGVPVVVNQWASWCPNCKQEFPFFQQLAHSYGGRVAFVGLDSQDQRGGAEAFLRGFPVTYPSIYDPAADQARSIGGGQGWPTTFYYDRTGRQTYVRQGGYVTLALLQADIQRYALGRSS
jgi:thiol-disulfide isomerase/thioredoxin